MDVDIVSHEEDQRAMESDLRALLAVHSVEDREQARQNHHNMMTLVAPIGQNGKKYRREATKRLRAIVSEVYSAPRVAAMAERHPRIGIVPGLSLDPTGHDADGNPWDFNLAEQRSKAEALMDQQRPMLLIGSPMCTAFSNIQNLNKAKRDPAIVKDEYERACVHLRWCCHLYRKQIARGAHFLHEHPAGAT